MMRKAILLSSIALMLISTSSFAASLEHDKRKQSKVISKKVQHAQKRRVDNRKKYTHHRPKSQIHHLRPAKKLRPIKRHVYRPKHVIRPHHRPGYRTKRLHRNAFHFILGGLTYHYLSGVYYRPYDNGYRVVAAPRGAVVYTLPHGHVSVVIGGRNYYMYNNIYYLWDGAHRGYRVVDTPTSNYVYDSPSQVHTVGSYQYRSGDVALNLPSGSIPVVIDGIRYYENEGIYFLPTKQNGKRVYKVVDVY